MEEKKDIVVEETTMVSEEVDLDEKKDNSKLKKIIKIIAIIIAIVVVIALIVFASIKIYQNATKETKKVESLADINSKKGVFTINDDELKLGGTYKSLKDAGYVFDSRYISEDDLIGYDMIYVQTVLKDEKEQFLGMFYCPDKEGCKYEDTILIKATFYKDINYKIAGEITKNSSYDSIKEAFKKEKGYFKDDNSYYIWTFGEAGKVGEPYYMIKFAGYNSYIKEIRIGVWWYEEEYRHTVSRKSEA